MKQQTIKKVKDEFRQPGRITPGPVDDADVGDQALSEEPVNPPTGARIADQALIKCGLAAVRVPSGITAGEALELARKQMDVPPGEVHLVDYEEPGAEQKNPATTGTLRARKLNPKDKVRANRVVEIVPQAHGVKGICGRLWGRV